MSDSNYCYNCRFYQPYYTKGYIKFDRLDCGRCGRTKAGVDKHNSCEYFSYLYFSRVDRKEAALAALTEHVHLLAEIKQILDESDDEALEEFYTEMKRLKKKKK